MQEIVRLATQMQTKRKKSLAGRQRTEFWKCAKIPGDGRKTIQTDTTHNNITSQGGGCPKPWDKRLFSRMDADFKPQKKFEKNCKKHLHFFSGRATILMVMVRWSSGQDAALSRRKHGFDSRTDCYRKSPGFWVKMPEALQSQCIPAFFCKNIVSA